MYTVTIKIADAGTDYLAPDPRDMSGESKLGHMWYVLKKDGVSKGSYGFAPIENQAWYDFSGEVKPHDDRT